MEAEFLAAWKAAIKLQPKRFFPYFGVSSVEEIDAVADKDDLRPDHEIFDRTLGSISSGEALYLISLYSFFSDTDAKVMCERYNISFPTVGRLSNYFANDKKLVAIIELMRTFPGW